MGRETRLRMQHVDDAAGLGTQHRRRRQTDAAGSARETSSPTAPGSPVLRTARAASRSHSSRAIVPRAQGGRAPRRRTNRPRRRRWTIVLPHLDRQGQPGDRLHSSDMRIDALEPWAGLMVRGPACGGSRHCTGGASRPVGGGEGRRAISSSVARFRTPERRSRMRP
jgi:hypothetical protein